MLLGHQESSELKDAISALQEWLRDRSEGLDQRERDLLRARLEVRLAAIDARLAQSNEQEAVRLLNALLFELGIRRRMSIVLGAYPNSDTLRGEPMGNTRSSGRQTGQQTGRLTALRDGWECVRRRRRW